MTHLHGRYFGQSGPLFWLYIRTALLTLVTFGIYRFWAKTRIRKYIWSATAGGEDSFEYTGTGLEKFLGFLVAIVILAIFLGLLNMLLMFAGLNVMGAFDGTGDELLQVIVIYANLFTLLPLMLFAAYRARRYKLARTRWRSLRFGMDNGAWGYVLRALGYYLLAVLSLGILTPLATFKLEKYMVDRTWYGDARMAQGGKWTALYPGLKHLAIALVTLVGGSTAGVMMESPALAGIAFTVGYIWFLVGAVYYRIYAFNYMMRHKELDGAITFDAQAETGQVIKIVLLGTLAVIGAFIVGALVLALLLSAIFGINMGVLAGQGNVDPGNLGMASVILGSIVTAVGYIALILVVGAVNLVMITQKVIAHVVSAVTLANAPHLDQIQQRAADTGADAEGFADALDIGGAI
ncbi:MAG: DUF898 family protein [Pseudomonadota bacterium]